MTLKLSVPAIDPSNSAAPETRPRHVQTWIDSLPLSQAFEASRSVTRTLAELNRVRLSDEDRLRLMEIFHPIIVTLQEELSHNYTGVALPLPTKAREAAALAREMLVETSYAYKLALLDKSVKTGLFSAKRTSAVPVGRAIAALSEILTTSYRSYNPTPAGVWFEIHQLYRHASQEGLLDTPPDDKSDSPHLVYKKALLLALADPYHLVHDAQDSVQRVIHDNASSLLLQNHIPDAVMPGLFSVNTLSDMPPRPVALQQTERDRTHDLLLQTHDLVHRIDRLASQAESVTRSGAVRPRDSGHLRRLSQLWSAPPKRIFRRSSTQASVQLCFGMKPTHYFVGADAKVREAATTASQESLLNTMKMAALQLSKNWETFSFSECDLINQSAGGLKLRRDTLNAQELRVGEIVGVRQSTFGGQSLGVSVGSVRWVQSDDDEESIEFGVQMLAPKAFAVSVVPAMDLNGSAQAAMLLPAIPALQQAESLLVSPGIYAEASEYTIDQNGKTRRVCATKLVQQTLRFELFEFIDR
jgi:cyclic-di-GMP-binding protein